MSEPTLPGEDASGFKVYVNDTLGTVSSVSISNDTYAGQGVTVYEIALNDNFYDVDTIELDYVKPTSNYVTDQSANLNPLLNFTNRISVRNLYSNYPPFGPGFITDKLNSSKSYIDENGLDLYLSFNINKYYKTLPVSGLSTFNVFIDGNIT